MKIMKFFSLLFCSFFFASVSFPQKKADSQNSNRIEKTINTQWTFNYFPDASAGSGCESPGFDDSTWPAVSLPYVWNTFETTGELRLPENDEINDVSDVNYWYRGWGWYRKHFSIKSDYTSGNIFVEFEGVNEYCKVWVNGKYLGDHKGSTGRFDFDLTSIVKPGTDNIICVAVKSPQRNSNSDPSAFGGIIRDVRIVLKDKLYIPMQGSAGHEGGTFISTPILTNKDGIVRILTWVKNDNPAMVLCTLQTFITTSSNENVTSIKSDAEIQPGELYRFEQVTKSIRNPHIWSDNDPYLYYISSKVLNGKILCDAQTGTFGFRKIKYDSNSMNLVLNGNKIEVRRIDGLIKYPFLGPTVPVWIYSEQVKTLSLSKSANVINTSHFPYDGSVFDFTDRSGIMAEQGVTGLDGLTPIEIAQQIKELIRRDRNHPSIISWITADPKTAISEDSTRISLPQAGSYTTMAAASKALPTLQNHPVKIVVTCKPDKLIADPGSIAILTADVVDDKGISINDAENTLKWTLSGQATLVGPSIFARETGKPQKDFATFESLPVSNIIRSNGNPGKIHIIVAASGLISGSYDLEAVQSPPENTVINEPVLRVSGRSHVSKRILPARRLEETPKEINFISEDITAGHLAIKEYKTLIRNYILKNNTKIDTLSIEFRSLINLFAAQLVNADGHISSGDFNYSADHFNSCRLIAGYINSTKLPPVFKDGLRAYYSDEIIRKGNEKNAGDEMNWLNWIPSGGTVVIVKDGKALTAVKGTLVCAKQGLTEVITTVYPKFVTFSDDAKERALLFVGKMNPYVHSSVSGNVVSYTAEEGQPVLVPLLKFISE